MLLLLAAGASAQEEVAAQKPEAALRLVSRAAYGAELGRMQGLVEACRVQPKACDGKAVPADERVGAAAADAFTVHWDWLRGAIKKGADAKDKDRETALAAAGERLRRETAEVATAAAPIDAASAQRKADEVLNRAEFRTVQQNTWWQSKIAALEQRVDAFFSRAFEAVPWSPWMTVVLQWGLLGGAVAGLLLWVFRLTKQQRVGLQAERVALPVWQAESERWSERAAEEAARGEWREAVHCLYWSAIVMLEGQRLWRPNGARTPREYVGLLEQGSVRRVALGGLTGVFERIWYGIRPATSEDYAQASTLLAELRVGR